VTDRLAPEPQNATLVKHAALCACDPEPNDCHVYDTTKWNGHCPYGSEKSVLLTDVLKDRSITPLGVMIANAAIDLRIQQRKGRPHDFEAEALDSLLIQWLKDAMVSRGGEDKNG